MNRYKSRILKTTLSHLNAARDEVGMPAFQYDDTITTEGEESIRLFNAQTVLNVCLQSWAPQQNFSALLKRLKSVSGEAILLADFINPVMAEKLREKSIQFVDCSANMLLHRQGLDVFQQGNADVRLSQKRVRGRVFNPAGLRLLYAFFTRPELLNVSYRSIASEVGVALGSIGPVFDELLHSGYLAEQDDGKYLLNKKRLFERWVDAYLEKLRPRQLQGSYRSLANDWWKSVKITDYDMQWGGEVVIARQTPFLLPDTITIYSQHDNIEPLLTNCPLQPDGEGDVIIYRAFWPNVTGEENVKPMIAYADLLDSVDPANWEVAKTFYGEAVADFLKE